MCKSAKFCMRCPGMHAAQRLSVSGQAATNASSKRISAPADTTAQTCRHSCAHPAAHACRHIGIYSNLGVSLRLRRADALGARLRQLVGRGRRGGQHRLNLVQARPVLAGHEDALSRRVVRYACRALRPSRIQTARAGIGMAAGILPYTVPTWPQCTQNYSFTCTDMIFATCGGQRRLVT